MLDLLAPGLVLTRAKIRNTLAVKNERLGAVLDRSNEPAASAAPRRVGNAPTDPRRTVPVPLYRERGTERSWSTA